MFPPLDGIPVVRFVIGVVFFRCGPVDEGVPIVGDFSVDRSKPLVEVLRRDCLEEVEASFDKFVFEEHESRVILRSRL